MAWLLPRLVGTGTAMDLLLSARVVLAEEALALGLVDRVFDPDELLPATLTYAGDLARSCSPSSMAAIKAQVLGDWEGTAEQSRLRAKDLVRRMLDEPDFAEGVRSFVEKRPPRFAGVSSDVDAEPEPFP